MPFQLLDVANSFYAGLDEGLPTSVTDVTTSRISLPNFFVTLIETIRQLNDFTPYVQHTIIPVVATQRQYKLPTDFITETSVRYRGFPLRPAVTKDPTFLFTVNSTYPWQYDIFYPGTASSALPVTGNLYLVVDPPPSESSPAGLPPLFPSFNDPYLVIFYKARIPTDWTNANYATYTFNLPEEYHPVFSDLCLAKVMSREGKNDIFQEALVQAVEKIKRINAYTLNQTENNPDQIQNLWDYDF